MAKAITNVRIYDYHQYIDNGYVVFDDTIIEVGEMADFQVKGYEIIDGSGKWLLPAFVVGHTHIYSTFARGWITDFNPKNFQDILEQMWWKLDRSLNNKATYYSGIVHAVDALKNGVTTVIDHHASGADITGSLNALKKSVTDKVGLRGLFCFETSDRFDVLAAINENIQFLTNNNTKMVGSHFGLHASMSLSEDTLKRVSKVIKHHPIHIHVAESDIDQKDALNKYNERVIHRLARHKLLNKDSIITHGLYMDEAEMDLVKKHQCVVALNVSSNMNNGVGLPNYHALKAKEIPVILGNDGLSTSISSEYLTLLYAMHLKDASPNRFTLNDIQKIMHDTYRYVSRRLGVQLGKIDKDYQADFLLVPYTPPTPIHSENALGHIFYGLLSNFKPESVYINGVQKVSNYRVSESLESMYKEALKVSENLWETIRNEGKQ